MDFQEIVDIIEDHKETVKIQRLKKSLKFHLKRLENDNYLAIGLAYYYLLRLSLLSHTLYETRESLEYFFNMQEAFLNEEKRILQDVAKHSSSNDLREEMKSFYSQLEKCYASLEVLYQDRHFLESRKRTYERKMIFRKNYFYHSKQRWKWFEYYFLHVSSNFGDSFLRWGFTSLFFAFVLAGIYFLLDYRLKESYRIIPSSGHWFDYIYFSIQTLTSLGFGDVIPHTFLAKFFVTLEVFFGFIMLGIFITLIQRKL